jgi:hypothetical protein
MAVEGEEEQQRWEASLQARTEQKTAVWNQQKKRRNSTRQQERLTKTSPKIEVGRGQREMEVLKSRTAVQVQRLRSAGSGKGTPEDDKVRS